MNLTPSAISLLTQRYCNTGEQPTDVFPRVAKALGQMMNGDNRAPVFEKMMKNLDFLPNSPCLRNAGMSNQVKACMTDDTVIHCAHGDYTVRQLLTQDTPLYVFSRDDTGAIRCAKATKPKLTHQGVVVFRITMDSGQSIKLTADHLVMLRTGEYKRADMLCVGESLMPFTFYRNKHNHRIILQDNWQWIPAYRIVYDDINGPLPEGYARHHLDEDGSNDQPSNLAGWPFDKHSSYHMKGNTIGAYPRSDETKQRMSAAQLKYHKEHPASISERKNMSVAATQRFENPEERQKISDTLKGGHNHKIISIDVVEAADVYDIEIVDKYHNFAANGIFIHNCFVLPIEDSMESIFTTLQRSALIFKSGGGVGYNFSDLREKDAKLSHGGTSSGAVSFIKLYDALTDVVKQGGMRRGASMGILDYDYPEIVDFVTAKIRTNALTNFNISVLITDEFMRQVEKGEKISLKSRKDRRVTTATIKANDLFAMITTSAWMCGDPGLLFYDRINKDNPYYPKHPIRATNPCGEVPLLPYESCCLGSLNLAHYITNGDIDVSHLEEDIENGMYFLMAMNKICEYPVPECYVMQAKTLRTGLGVMGFADMLMQMHIMYDSDETLTTIDKIGKLLQKSHKIAPQSAATLSIAPTGSLSILADCSSGIEPIFDANYERHVTIGVIKESRSGEYLRTAHEISPEWHLKVLARWQKWIDNGVSKTINMPYESSVQDVQDMYTAAWKSGCKGVTVFRDGCRGDQVYKRVTPPKCEGESCHL